MSRFPVDAPLIRVIRTLEVLSFGVVRRGHDIAMIRDNPDGTKTPPTMPDHRTIKASTSRTILTQAGIARNDFLDGYDKS